MIYHEDESTTVHLGDCLDVMRTMEAESVDAVVTDPPAGISFMNASWDSNKGSRNQWIAWLTEVMEEALRVMKPGAHGLVWALPRTSHWTGMALEDAGFEVREKITHHFGSGFPKSANIGKNIDKMAGAERELVGHRPLAYADSDCWGTPNSNSDASKQNLTGTEYTPNGNVANGARPVTAPATDEAKRWEGWGSGLKPSTEDWWLVRKPLSEKNIALNVLKHSTGGINVDASRIRSAAPVQKGAGSPGFGAGREDGYEQGTGREYGTAGRFPSNLLLSHVPPTEFSPGCVRVGTKRVKAPKHRNPSEGNGNGSAFDGGALRDRGAYDLTDPDGTEQVEAWDCAEGWTEERESYEYAGLKIEPVKSSPSALSIFLYLLVSELRLLDGNAGSGDQSSDESSRASMETSQLNSLVGCPACCRLYDELVQRIQESAQASPQQLADALEYALDLAPVSLHNRRFSENARPSRGDGVPDCKTDGDMAQSKSGVCSSTAPCGHEQDSHTVRRGISEPTLSSLPSNKAESNISAPGEPIPPTLCRNAGKCEVFRPLVSVALDSLAHYLPIMVTVQELYHQGCPVRLLDEQSGTSKDGVAVQRNGGGQRIGGNGIYQGSNGLVREDAGYGSRGGASRFFMQFGGEHEEHRGTTASARERGAGGTGKNAPKEGEFLGDAGFKYCAKASRKDRGEGNTHSTVKPTALMRYLCKLITPPGGLILDPFAGSGTTLLAARQQGFRALGIEKEEEYAAIIAARLADAPLVLDVG